MKINISKKSIIFMTIVSVVSFILANRIADIYLSVPGTPIEKILAALDTFLGSLLQNPFGISLQQGPLITGAAGAALAWLIWLYCVTNTKNWRRGEEHGSAEWSKPKDIKPFIDAEDPDNNIIFSETEKMILDEKDLPFEYKRNKNIAVVGGSGAGKTYSVYMNNILQMNSSYVITDPKATMIPQLAPALERGGYVVKYFNTINFKKSLHYNPLAYIENETDILRVVTVLLENTKGEGKSRDDFWEKSEKLLYCALIGYLFTECQASERNIPGLVKLLDQCQAKEDNEEYVSVADQVFMTLDEKDPDCFAARQYRKFKQAAGKTLKSILISCASRLAPFDIPELREIVAYDEIDLKSLAQGKTALFLMMSDTDNTYNFIMAMLLFQMFLVVCAYADDECGGKLPLPLQCYLDEFANIGEIPNFKHLISTIRSRGGSAVLGLQSESQLVDIYKKEGAASIIDSSDTYIFMGGQSQETTRNVSEKLGKETIDIRTYNENKGASGGMTINNALHGRELLTQAEVAQIDKTKCIVSISGIKPFFSKKYDLKKHPRYSWLEHDKQKLMSTDFGDLHRRSELRAALPNENTQIWSLEPGDRLDDEEPERCAD